MCIFERKRILGPLTTSQRVVHDLTTSLCRRLHRVDSGVALTCDRNELLVRARGRVHRLKGRVHLTLTIIIIIVLLLEITQNVLLRFDKSV